MSTEDTPLPGQTRCPAGHLCARGWAFCPECGEPLDRDGAGEEVTSS